MAIQTLTATIHKEGNLYVAACIEIGTISQGESLEDALNNLKEATHLYLEAFPTKVVAPTFFTTFTTEAYN